MFIIFLILISPIIIKQIHNLISILPSYVSKIEILIMNLVINTLLMKK